MARRVAIRAGWIVAFDGQQHRLLRDGVVVLEGERIVHVGRTYDGAADETVDARDHVLTPGLISTHAHISGSPLDRSFIEDRGNPQFWYSGLFEMLPVRGEAQDEEAARACVDFSMAELLRGGVTTVMEIGGLGEYVVERAAHYGLRVYMGLTFRSGRWLTRDGRRVVWEWNEEDGRRGLRRAQEFFDKHDGAHGGLVRCYFSPAQVDTCSAELLREAKRHADAADRPFTLHTSQSVVEFNEMLQRHGKTPVAWLDELGVLGPNTVLGHAIIIGGSSWTNYPAGDVALMAEAGCTVAHAPWVFARRGVVMESFALYRAAGINVALGTDTNPQSVIEAMRWAAVCSKIVERNTQGSQSKWLVKMGLDVATGLLYQIYLNLEQRSFAGMATSASAKTGLFSSFRQRVEGYLLASGSAGAWSSTAAACSAPTSAPSSPRSRPAASACGRA